MRSSGPGPSGSGEAPNRDVRVAQAEQFLGLLFEECRGWFGVSRKTGKGYTTTWYDASQATCYPMAARNAVNLYEVDTYVRLTTVGANLGPTRRGRAGDSVEMTALYLDVDDRTGVHKHDAAELPPDIETGLSTLLAGGLPEPSLVISSGGGCYPIWLLSTPITDVAEMKEISDAWHLAAESIFRASGFHLDKVSDLSRMLRVPGTLNAKDPTDLRLATIRKPPSNPAVRFEAQGMLDLALRIAPQAPRPSPKARASGRTPRRHGPIPRPMVTGSSGDPFDALMALGNGGHDLVAGMLEELVEWKVFDSTPGVGGNERIRMQRCAYPETGAPTGDHSLVIGGSADGTALTGLAHVFSSGIPGVPPGPYNLGTILTAAAFDGDPHRCREYLISNGIGTMNTTTSIASSLSTPSTQATLPVLGAEAYHGVVGDAVRAVAPHSEAGEAAILVCLLTMLGNLIGPGPYTAVGATHHSANLFTLIIGATAKSRKGTALSEARRIALLADPDWERRIISGIGSGEAIISRLSDVDPSQIQPGEVPPPVDKRSQITEEEFARVLKVADRSGSTISEVLRSAWDGIPLQNITKHLDLKATGTHISMIGQITMEEFASLVSKIDVNNGLINRHLMVMTERSKLLPNAGQPDPAVLLTLQSRLQHSVTMARSITEVTRTGPAENRWAEIYVNLESEQRSGLLGAATARTSAQLLRLAMIYALLDAQPQVDVVHLNAALAVCNYSCDSAAMIFPNKAIPTDKREQQLWQAILDKGEMNLTEISALFSRHLHSEDRDKMLDQLVADGRIVRDTVETSGRPATVYRPAKEAQKAVEDAAAESRGRSLTKVVISNSDAIDESYVLPSEWSEPKQGTLSSGMWINGWPPPYFLHDDSC